MCVGAARLGGKNIYRMSKLCLDYSPIALLRAPGVFYLSGPPFGQPRFSVVPTMQVDCLSQQLQK